MTAALNSYDEVPYASKPVAASHPDRLATVATLLGMHPPPIDRCRVLELGCASGDNLFPLALEFPDSRFLGIDASQRQIDDGKRTVAALGLTNLDLRHLSILDVGEDFGVFDYILCHGVFSWVPRAVQDKILDLCAHHLSPQGVAFISYNTYPGWHMQRMIRDVMSFHARRFSEPATRVREARSLLDFLAESVPQQDNPYGLLLKKQVEFLHKRSDSYLYHEHLEDVNEPIYFYEFAERAAGKGLQYVSEADMFTMSAVSCSPQVAERLRRLSPDVIHLQQYLDFLRNTQFRQSLLCRREVPVDSSRRPDQLAGFHIASPVRPVSPQPDLHSAAMEEFRGPHGGMSSKQPLVKAAMFHLSAIWPESVPFPQLVSAACTRLGLPPSDADAGRLLAESLLNGYLSLNLLEFRLHPPRLVRHVSERPVASPLARLQAQSGDWATNQRHEVIALNAVERQVLRLLDGSRDRAALTDALADAVARGELQGTHNGRPLREVSNLRELLAEALGACLLTLARCSLLIG